MEELIYRGALLGWTAIDLARAAGVGEEMVRLFETGQRKSSYKMTALVDALKRAGVVFTKHGVKLIEEPLDLLPNITREQGMAMRTGHPTPNQQERDDDAKPRGS